MPKLQQNHTKIQLHKSGLFYTSIPKKIVERCKLSPGCVIVWSKDYEIPHIERVIDVKNNRDIRLQYLGR